MSDRERIAYEELRPGTEVQAGDQYRNTQGRWVEYSLDTSGVLIVGPTAMARRPRNITQMLAEFANQAEVLAEVRADEKRLFDDLELLRSEYMKLQTERDELQRQVDELRADRERLQGLIDNLLDEPTAKRVYKMLEDMLDQTEWVGQCLDSSTFEQMSCIQRTISVIAERVRDMVKEGTSAND